MTQGVFRRRHWIIGGAWFYRVLALFSLCGALWGLIPLVSETINNAGNAIEQLPSLSAWRAPALRSLVFMVICAPVCVIVGFILGSRLADSRTKISTPAGLLLIPILLGGGVNAFVFKLCFADITPIASALKDRNPIAFWLSLLSIFLWQYVPCVTFFCWWSCSQISSNRRAFAVAHRLSFFERLGDIYWRQCRNLLIYLFLLISAACAAEYERSALVFRASEGTGTEFFSHWLLKAYFTTSRVDPLLAGKTVLFYAAIFAVVFIPVAGAMAFLVDRLAPNMLRKIGAERPHKGSPSWWDSMLLPSLITVVLLPFVPTLFRGLPLMANLSAARCALSFLLPTMAAGTICVAFSILARFGWPKVLSDFNTFSLTLCLGIAAVGFLPPIALAFMGMWWMSRLQFLYGIIASPVIGLWWLLLCLASLPIFFPGYLATQFVVDYRELAFQFRHRASFIEVFKNSFLTRLWPVYALFGVFVYSFMWSEYPLTALFSGLSADLCSPVLDLAVRIEGKGAQFDEAASIILQMALPLLACTIAFGVWTKKRTSKMRAS